MKKRIVKFALVATILLALPFSVGLTQDFEYPADESTDEYEPEYEEDVPPDIVKTMTDYGSLETFLGLLDKAGLMEKLKGQGPFTLFVPDDSAFAQLEPAQFEKLTSDPEYLKEVLSRHIVAGHRVEFGDNPESLTVKALNGAVINIEVTEESVRIEQAWVIDEQIECSNGLLHVIDAVLLPPEGQRKG